MDLETLFYHVYNFCLVFEPSFNRQHFYHLGGKKNNRHPIFEALITNFQSNYIEINSSKSKQLSIF